MVYEHVQLKEKSTMQLLHSVVISNWKLTYLFYPTHIKAHYVKCARNFK